MSEQHDRSRERFVKVAINLPPSDWHPHALETMWAEPLGDDRYRLQNVPFYAYGLSFDDVVNARQIGGQLFVQDVIERGGHSTYRIFLSQGVAPDKLRFRESWRQLEEIGVTYEQANDRLLAVDVPASTDIYRAYELLQRGEEAGVWDFEEAHCGHPLQS
ncbi:MAG: DUF4265 domain-containing protein [Thermoanaerobaculia bacterium]